ncbi:MAG: ATP-binding protein, partial [Defluviitaleaceae bacterium]|nr:ATP-binding protein [Defluviitaleaceae bacterium]
MAEIITVASLLLACATMVLLFRRSSKFKSRYEEYARASFAFDTVHFVLTIWDENLQIIDSNMEAVRRFGLSRKEEYIERRDEIIPANQPPGYMPMERCFKLLSNVPDSGQLVRNVMHYNLNGEQIPMEVVFFKGNFKNRPVVLTCASDMSGIYESMEAMLSERERSAVVEANSEAKSRFLARMSHEIRTPITAVLGISEILLQQPEISDETEESITKIFNASSSLIRIINDILDLSKIEASKMSLVYSDYETANLLSDIVQINAVMLGSKPLNLVVRIDENIPVALTGDEIRIRQVLNNVLSNAIKYTDEGSVSFTAECYPHPEKPDYIDLYVTIRDTGRGMSREQLDVLFTEFTRFHEFEDRFTEGTGLGMPIVYSLLQLMSADIDIDSRVGEGTAVIIRIPQQIANVATVGAETARKLEQFEIGSKRATFKPEPMPHGSVLVVDDVETNRFVARGLLGFYGLNVETCVGGKEAIELIESGKSYDIIFMDHMMPGLNGIETTQILRETGYVKPILALTANMMMGKAEEFTAKGFDGFVGKPIQSSELDAALRTFIRAKREPAGTLDVNEDYYSRPEVVQMIRADFVENHADAADKFREALAADDIESAKRVAHTIASLARY